MTDFDLNAHIEDYFKVPIGIINDANAGALGEQRFNLEGDLINNLLYIKNNPLVGGMG